MERRGLQAMGTSVELLVDAPPGPSVRRAMDAASAEIGRLEAMLSRFRPDSRLSALNRAGRLRADAELLEVVGMALEARARTGGRFDPTVHDALLAAGYDRSFELVAGAAPAAAGEPAPACGGGVALDRGRGMITLAPGVRLDLGGIAKGYIVDRAAERLAEAGPCLVNAGGDLRIAGRRRARPWPVGVAVPGPQLTLALEEGAVATSGRDRRCWLRGGREVHHIIDPASGRPATGDLRTVTVVSERAAEAEVLATDLFLRGLRDALRTARARALAAVLVTTDRRVVLAGTLA